MDISSLSFFNKLITSYGKLYDVVDSMFTTLINKHRRMTWVVVIALSYGVILTLNILTPISADDFGYMYIHATNTKVESFADIIQSQINHYYLWGGRSVVHVIAQGLLLLPSWGIDILNSLVYIVFIFLICSHIVGRSKSSISLFILINIALWILLPAYGDTILWITGSSNYLWGTSIILLMLLPYRLYKEGKGGKISRQILISAGMFILGIIAGWTNENTAAAMLFIMVLFLVHCYSEKKRIPAWAVLGLLGGMIGYVLMIIAPGNYVRAGEAVFFSPFLIIYRFLTYTQTLFINYGNFNLLYFILIILMWRFSQLSKVAVLKLSSLYFIGMLVAIYDMVLSPSFPSRAWFGPIVFNVLAFGVVFYNLDYSQRFLRQIRFLVLLFGIIISGFSFYDGLRDIITFNRISHERMNLVNNLKEAGAEQCVFRRYTAMSKFVHTEEPTSYYMMRRYYGIDIVFDE